MVLGSYVLMNEEDYGGDEIFIANSEGKLFGTRILLPCGSRQLVGIASIISSYS